jgi:biofilm protein TabA
MLLELIHNPCPVLEPANRLAAALRWLRETELIDLSPGRYDIGGESLYAQVSEFVTRPVGRGTWEAHRRFIDIHCVIAGEERMGWAPVDSLTAGEYDAENDFYPLQGQGGAFFTLRPGRFALMGPADAHMPGLMCGARPEPLRKVVVKVAVNEPSR